MQTNVYDTAQKRKMRPFAGFKRKAVVVLPTDKVFRERIEKRTKEEGKEVPETAVLEMKGRHNLAACRHTPLCAFRGEKCGVLSDREYTIHFSCYESYQTVTGYVHNVQNWSSFVSLYLSIFFSIL